MDDEEHGLVRHTDPNPSHEAARETDASRQHREIRAALEARRGDGRWYSCFDLADDHGGITGIKYASLTPRMKWLRNHGFVDCVEILGLNDKGKLVNLLHYRITHGSTPMNFDLGERIRQVRAIEQKIDAMEKAFNETLKPYEEFAEGARAEILEFLNATNQKSANTPHGTAYWKPKVTYRVADKDEFKRHVIGMEAWELITWAAAGTAAEAFTNEHAVPPPGCVRNSVNILYITAPAKPRTKVAKAEEMDDDELPKAAE